jgi:hypothetical protein
MMRTLASQCPVAKGRQEIVVLTSCDCRSCRTGESDTTRPAGSYRLADDPGITDDPEAARDLRSDWLATEHVLQTYRGLKHSGFAATLCG